MPAEVAVMNSASQMQLAPARDTDGRDQPSVCDRTSQIAIGICRASVNAGVDLLRADRSSEAGKRKSPEGIPGISIQSSVKFGETNSGFGYGVRSAVTSRASRTTSLLPAPRRQD